MLIVFQTLQTLYLTGVCLLTLLTLILQAHPHFLSSSWSFKRLLLFCTLVAYGLIPASHWVFLNGGFVREIVRVSLKHPGILGGCLAHPDPKRTFSIHVWVCVWVWVHVWVHVCVWVRAWVCVHVHFVWVCVHVWVRTCMCMYVYGYMYGYIVWVHVWAFSYRAHSSFGLLLAMGNPEILANFIGC